MLSLTRCCDSEWEDYTLAALLLGAAVLAVLGEGEIAACTNIGTGTTKLGQVNSS